MGIGADIGSLGKKSGIDSVESLLCDQARGTFSLKSTVNAFHFHHAEPCGIAQQLEIFRTVAMRHIQVLENWLFYDFLWFSSNHDLELSPTVRKKSNDMIFDCFLHWFGIDDFSRAASGLSRFQVSFLISCPISGRSFVCFGGDSIGIEIVKQKPSVTCLSIRSSRDCSGSPWSCAWAYGVTSRSDRTLSFCFAALSANASCPSPASCSSLQWMFLILF